MSDINEQDLLAQVNNEIAGMTPEQLQEELSKIRVRQKVQQKKQQGSASQKAYQKKQNEKRKAMIAKAKELGIYDAIEAAANEKAEQLLAEEAEANETDTEV